MTDAEIQSAAERFVDVLCDAKQPEVRCHPRLTSHCQKIVDAMNDLRKKMYRAPIVKLVPDDYVPFDRIYAMDMHFMNQPWETFDDGEMAPPRTHLQYDFSFQLFGNLSKE